MGVYVLKFTVISKFIAVLFFFSSFQSAGISMAHSASQSSHTQCSGTNLVSKLGAESPERLERILAEASKIIFGKGIFWKLEKEGQKPSWLFGTMHMTDPEVTTLSPQVVSALERSEIVVIESTETLDPAAAAKAMVKLKHLTFLNAQSSLKNMLSNEELAVLEERLTSRGIPLQIASQLRPWVVATMIGVPACELAAKQKGAKILDHQIAEHAISNEKTLVGLETTEEQFKAIAGLPENYHLTNLQEVLAKDPHHVEDMIATMKALYKNGQIGLILPLMKALTPKAFEGEGAAAFQQAMIVERNKTMVERAQKVLAEGNTFVAVGALHLPGENGLLNLLENQGYRVTPVDDNAQL